MSDMRYVRYCTCIHSTCRFGCQLPPALSDPELHQHNPQVTFSVTTCTRTESWAPLSPTPKASGGRALAPSSSLSERLCTPPNVAKFRVHGTFLSFSNLWIPLAKIEPGGKRGRPVGDVATAVAWLNSPFPCPSAPRFTVKISPSTGYPKHTPPIVFQSCYALQHALLGR